jgi:hypothetical protein
MVGDVDNQPDKAIDEILPRPRRAGQAPFEETSVDFRESHDALPEPVAATVGANPLPSVPQPSIHVIG